MGMFGEDPEQRLERMTPDEVLAALRECRRQACAFVCAGAIDIDLSHDTPITDWRRALDMEGWTDAAQCINEVLGTTITQEKLDAVLESGRAHTLRDLSELIAVEAQRPVVEPVNVLGRKCWAAGAFFTIRWTLARLGVDRAGVTPSAALDPYLRSDGVRLAFELVKLAPGCLPLLRAERPGYDRVRLLAFGTSPLLLVTLAAMCMGYDVPLRVLALVMIVACSLLAIRVLVGWYIPPKRVTLGDLKTFRDLSILIADASRERAQEKPG